MWRSRISVSTVSGYCDRPYKKEGGNQIFPMPQVSERAARKNLIATLLGIRGDVQAWGLPRGDDRFV